MQVMRTFQRAEITFWTAMIALMRSRRLVRFAAFVMLLVICVSLIGIVELVVARKATPVHQEITAPPEQPQAVIAAPLQGQRNTLVILVDSISASPARLEGLWLVGQLSANPQLVFFPIFPTSTAVAAGEWERLFGLDGQGQPSATFVEYLAAKNIRWDHYLIVDHASLAELIELAGRIQWDGQQLSGPAVVAKMPPAQLEPLAALQAQAFVAQELCKNTAALLQSADPGLIWGLLTHRMHSDLDLGSVQAARDELTSRAGGATCEFPTFQQLTLLTGAP